MNGPAGAVRHSALFCHSCLAILLCAGASPAGTGEELRALTGSHARVVWVQDSGDKGDAFIRSSSFRLMGLDSDDGKGERAVLAELSNYVKPLLTPRGKRVVFSNLLTGKAFVVGFDGGCSRELADGLAVEVWMDKDGVEWAYVQACRAGEEANSRGPIRRFRIDDPKVQEPVWDRTPVEADNFQVSADGTKAAGSFPWPDCGLADLPNGQWSKIGNGCWPSLAPDNSCLSWLFDGAHRNVYLFRPGDKEGAKVQVNTAPGIDGFEVYHPRWSNHVRFLVVTGPYKVGSGDNKIGGGGKEVEVYLGRFNKTFTAVEAWARVTHNDKGDFYPDAWVEGGRDAVATLGPASAPATGPASRPARLTVQARLVATTPTPDPQSILPYKHALVAYEYEVLKAVRGRCDAAKILVAHWAIRDSKALPGMGELKVGQVYELAVEPFADHPELEGQRLIIGSKSKDLPLYYDAGSDIPSRPASRPETKR